MAKVLHIPPGEYGKLHVLAINSPPQDLSALLQCYPPADVARQLLGAPHLHTARAELFDLRDLGDMGLLGYLRDAYDIDTGALAPSKARLEQLEGFVLLLPSSVVMVGGAALALGSGLTHIATLTEPSPQAPGAMPPAAARAAHAPTALGPRLGGRLASGVVGGAIIAGLILWWLLA